MSIRATDWLKSHNRFKDLTLSALGEAAAELLDHMWGLHNLSITSLAKVEWTNDAWIEVVIDKTMATVDNDDLTRLVVIAHQMMLRVELTGAGPGYLRMQIHQRTNRDKEAGFWAWCPDIIDHVDAIRKYHPDRSRAKG